MNSNSSRLLYTSELGEQPNLDSRPFSTLTSRAGCLEQLGENRNFDLVILGGGLTAALTAHQLALRGIRVLVLEARYFGAHGVAWRNSLSGAVRTKPLDIMRGLASLRAFSHTIAPHLSSLTSPDLPSAKTIRSGLALRGLRYLWRGAGRRAPTTSKGFPDLDEVLLIRELILAARQEGALALSYAQPIYVEAESESGCYNVGFRDLCSNNSYEVRAGGLLIDPTDGTLPATRLGTHILKVPERLPSTAQVVFQVEPRTLKGAGRFVSFELPDSSLVTVSYINDGVIEVALVCALKMPAPTAVLAIAREACEQAGWAIRATLSRWSSGCCYSRDLKVREQQGIFTIEERGPWDSFKSSAKVVRTMVLLAGERKTGITSRALPGVERACELDAFRALARTKGLSEGTIELVIQRWRGRVRYIDECVDGFREVVPGVLQGELELAVVGDQVQSIEELCFGTLALHYLPGWQELVAPLAQRLSESFNITVGAAAITQCIEARIEERIE